MGEVIRETPGVVAIYPVCERKGRAKQILIILRRTSLEIHKTLKDFKNNKKAKYKIILADLFNIALDNEPNQIKGECIILMTIEKTFFLLPNDVDSTLKDWFELLIERVKMCRSDKLLRPIIADEFFEAAWDINIIKKPKLRKDIAREEKLDDLAEKLANMQGRRRLCISSTSYLLFKLGAMASTDKEKPYEKKYFIELPLNVVSSYGKQERYFFVRVGRCSELGAGELWMAAENGPAATHLHDTLSKLTQRDADKRREKGIILSLGGISSRVLKSRQLRERSQQNKEREANLRILANSMTPTDYMNSNTTFHPAEPIISQPTPPLQSPQIEKLKEESKSSTPKKSSFADMAYKISSKLHYSGSSSSGGMFTANPEYTDNPYTEPTRTLSPRLYRNDAEDYMSYDPVVDSRKTSIITGAQPIRQTSVISATDSIYFAQDSSLNQHHRQPEEESNYTQMCARDGENVSETLKFPIKEARSYVSDISDSNESCYLSHVKRYKRDSATDLIDDKSHEQRAFSLGSKPPLKNIPLSSYNNSSNTNNKANINTEENEDIKSDDIRKRAYSAGSKTWSITNQKDIRNRTGSIGNNHVRKKQKEINDHVEMDFSDNSKQGSLASIDSPNVRSRNSSFGVQQSQTIKNSAELALNKLKILEKTANELAAVRFDEREPKIKNIRDNSFGSNTRRGSAPENSYNESDYVQIMCNKNNNRKIETITENVDSSLSSASTSDNESSETSDMECDNYETRMNSSLKKRSSIQDTVSNNSTQNDVVEYTIFQSNKNDKKEDVETPIIQPVLSFFGGSSSSMTSPPIYSSPQYSNHSTNCEYTVVSAPNKDTDSDK